MNIGAGALIDVALIIIAALIVIYHTKKGFAASVLGVVGFFMALVASVSLTDSLAATFYPLLEGKTSMFSADLVAKVFAFTIIFLIILILIRLFVYLAVMVIRVVPIISTLDKLGGFVLGILTALFWVQVLSLVITVFGGAVIDYYVPEKSGALDESVITGFFYNYNFFKRIFELVG